MEKSFRLQAPLTRSQGFTLVEMLVVITIITILTYLVLTGLPAARTQQKLQGDIQIIRSTLAQAQQQAVNEIRPEDCLDRAGGDAEIERRCSNVGVAIASGRLQLFSDLDNNRRFSGTQDYTHSEQGIASAVEGSLEIVFDFDPPTLITYANGDVLDADGQVALDITISEITRTLMVSAYGLVEEQQ